MRFLTEIFGYTALHYTVDRLNLQLSTCMVCLCKYHNSVTNLFSLAFQQLVKCIGSEICYPLSGLWTWSSIICYHDSFDKVNQPKMPKILNDVIFKNFSKIFLKKISY